MDKFRLKRYNIDALPTSLRRQLAPRPGHMEPGIPTRTKLVRVRVDRACLWSACKSTSLALMLILIGATMATVGYYAPELSAREEVRGNTTIFSTDPISHWHLKNLTYVGPAFMGLGCVIIVAICVMTFEARDKAAKICPEDPPKLEKDELYVNVIKNIVRKYSALPKVCVQEEGQYENAKLLPTPPPQEKKRTSHHLLEKPVDTSLGTRSSSEPCFAKSFLNDTNTQYPLVEISSSSDAAAAAPVVSSPDWGSTQPEVLLPSLPPTVSIAYYTKLPPVLILNKSSEKDTLPQSSGSIRASGSNPRRQSISGETVAEVHPLPQSCNITIKSQPTSSTAVLGIQPIYPPLETAINFQKTPD